MSDFYPEENVEQHFQNPTAEFRGAPFWAWNGPLTKGTLLKQIEVFKAMGFGGFHIHSRIGLDTPYLGPEFMSLVKASNEKGKELGMRTWLYDEDKWPSGFGAGWVTRDPKYRARYLLLSPFAHSEGSFDRHVSSSSRISRNGDIHYLCSYLVTLKGKKLVSYKMVPRETEGDVWHAYLVVTGDTPWFNNASYVDTLNPVATKKFLQVAYEAYYQELKDEFGKSIKTIFTDEPQFFRYETLHAACDKAEVGIPYSEVLDKVYEEKYGKRLLDVIPEIVWMPEKGISPAKLHYHDLLADQFSKSYSGQLGAWCEKHGIRLTGHVMGESTLDLQSRMVSEAMRAYPNFGLPGIDMLAKRREYMTAKQTESVVHQEGKPGMLCEIYGVTNWDFDFRGHKREGDWLAALGVTARVPHLSWVTMAGEAKRDYPAPIDQHSPWYKEYSLIENHFARLNLAMTRGRNITHIGVIHPIESFWSVFGPDDDTAQLRKTLDDQFASLAETLLFHQLDYEYISEASVPRLYDGKKSFGKSSYDVILVPGLITIRRSTLEMLRAFQKAGGKVIYIGRIPSYVDGLSSDDAKELNAPHCDFDADAICNFLADERELSVVGQDCLERDDLLYQLRQDGDDRWLFIAHGRDRDRRQKSNFRSLEDANVTITIRGRWKVTLYDTYRGKIQSVPAWEDKGKTKLCLPLYEEDSLLLKLEPVTDLDGKETKPASARLLQQQELPNIASYTLSEPNVLLLDQAEFALDDRDWQPKEEMLRLDDKVRQALGFDLRSEAHPQPWLYPPDRHYDHMVKLRFTFESEVAAEVSLATEMASSAIKLNGSWIVASPKGYFVDQCLPIIPLGRVKAGMNTLELSVPYGWKTNLEWCYLLGFFGVRVEGACALLTSAPKRLMVGDVTRQGLPFYGGNISYRLKLKAPYGRWILTVPEYRGALISVSFDGKEAGKIVGEPYEVDLGVQEGEHEVCLMLFGTRYNSFGQLHNANPFEAYWGPKTWRTKGSIWTYSYRLKPWGILIEPQLSVFEE